MSILIGHSVAFPVWCTVTQHLLVLSGSLAKQLARATKESKEWEQQTWELSDAVLRASDFQADMAKTLEDTRARHAVEMAAAEECAAAREEVRTVLLAAPVETVTC